MRLTITRDKSTLPQVTRAEVPVYKIFQYPPNYKNQLINLGLFKDHGKNDVGMGINVENGGIYIGHDLTLPCMIIGEATMDMEIYEEEGEQKTVECMHPSTIFVDGSLDNEGKPKLYALIGYSEEVWRSHIGLDISEDKIIPLPKKHQGRIIGKMQFNGQTI